MITAFAVIIALWIGWAIRDTFGRFGEAKQEGIPLNSKCPACGHRGCTLHYVAPTEIPTGDDKGTTRTEEARVCRKCSTCGALAYEKCVLDPTQWIAK